MAIKKGTKILHPNFEDIPDELKCSPNWLLWKAMPKDKPDELTKFPVNIKGDGFSWNNPSNLYTFKEVEKAYQTGNFDGVGFALKGTEFICIDLDNNVSTANISEELHDLTSCGYSEVSPSGKGYHIWLKGKKPTNMGKIGYTETGEKLEIFGDSGWVTMTGHAYFSLPIIEAQDLINGLYNEYYKKMRNKEENFYPAGMTKNKPDLEKIKENMFSARNGQKILALWNGNIRMYPSQSEADLALCGYLAYYANGDYVTIDTLFQQSGLYRPKWHRRWGNSTYGHKTIEKAIQGNSLDIDYKPMEIPPIENLENDWNSKNELEVSTETDTEKNKLDIQSTLSRYSEQIMEVLLDHIKGQEDVNRELLKRIKQLEEFNCEVVQQFEILNTNINERLDYWDSKLIGSIMVTRDEEQQILHTASDFQKETNFNPVDDVLNELNDLYEGINYVKEDENNWYFISEFEEMKVEKSDYALWYKDELEGWLFTSYLFYRDREYV